MIIGTYPQPFVPARRPGLRAVAELLDQLGLSHADLHVLPCYPSSGDAGFFADDWFSVDPAFGSVEDLSLLARGRELMLDGIYNHVGTGHRWWQEARRDGDTANRFFCFDHRPDARVIAGRRPGAGFDRVRLGDSWRWVWQTFGTTSVDLNLESPEVCDEIRAHLSWAARLGVRVIRLDACAFYGKSLLTESLHRPFSYAVVRRLSRWRDSLAPGLRLLAQVDIDPVGLAYLRRAPDRAGADAAYDYSFSALVAHALLCHDGDPLARHINRTGQDGARAVRPARTHDGVYLGSRLLDSRVRNELRRQVVEHGLLATWLGPDLFEMNTSLPLICRLAAGDRTAGDRTATWRWIGLAMGLCIATSDLPYLYLPALLGFAPELDADLSDGPVDTEPRRINRVPMPEGFVTRALRSMACRAVIAHLTTMSGARRREPHPASGVPRACWLPSIGLLVIDRSAFRFVANLATRPARLPGPDVAGTHVVADLGLDGRHLLAGGSVLLSRYAAIRSEAGTPSAVDR